MNETLLRRFIQIILVIVGLFVVVIVSTIIFRKEYALQTAVEKKDTMMDEFFYGSSNDRGPQKVSLIRDDLEVLAQGIKRPHGIGVHDGIVYVGSESDKALLRVQEGKIEKIADVNFPHDMLFEEDGTIVTSVFLENRVVRISPNGFVKEIGRDFSGPNGIVRGKNGDIYVSNYFGQTINLIANNRPIGVFARKLNGPAGMVYDNGSDTLYVANYLNKSISIFHNLSEKKIEYSDIDHIESLGLINGNLYATASKDGIGVIVQLKDSGTSEIVLKTGLPDPLSAYFDSSTVYFTSPNDSEGRIFRWTIEQ